MTESRLIKKGEYEGIPSELVGQWHDSSWSSFAEFKAHKKATGVKYEWGDNVATQYRPDGSIHILEFREKAS